MCYPVEKLAELQRECNHPEDLRVYLFDEVMGIEWYCEKCQYVEMGRSYEPREEV